MTNHYSLSTWMGQQMVRVENLTAADDLQAIAYAAGRLDERHQGAGATVLDLGVTYRLDRQRSDDPAIDLTPQSRVGDWFSIRGEEEAELLWVAHEHKEPPG